MRKIIFLFAFFILLLAACENTYTAYHNAKKQNTIDAYQNFIPKYPKSKYVDSANYEITFLKTGEYPQEKLASLQTEITLSQEDKIEKTLWNDTKYQDTKNAYQEFLILYPQTKYKDSAEIIINFLELGENLEYIYEDNITKIKYTLNLILNNKEITGTLTETDTHKNEIISNQTINGTREANNMILTLEKTTSAKGQTIIDNQQKIFIITNQGLMIDNNLFINNNTAETKTEESFG